MKMETVSSWLRKLLPKKKKELNRDEFKVNGYDLPYKNAHYSEIGFHSKWSNNCSRLNNDFNLFKIFLWCF